MTMFLEPLAFELLRHVASDGTRSLVPPADVVVTEDDVTVWMDVPGLAADDLTIELHEDVLTVSGERSLPYPTDEQQRTVGHRIERGFGKFERVLNLPKGLDADAISAVLDNGVLTLRIPKPQERKPRRIEIATGSKTDTIEATASDQRELAGSTA